MPDIRHRIRRAVEAWVPWFDRAQFDRDRTAQRRELEESQAIRAHARMTIQQSYRQYADRVRR